MQHNNTPATKADVAKVSKDLGNLAIATKNTFDRMEKKMGHLATKDHFITLKNSHSKLEKKITSLEKGQASLIENQERILFIVESIDQHFKEHRDIPRKVEQLEADVFKLKTRQQ